MDKNTKEKIKKLSENLQTWLNTKLTVKDAITEQEKETTNIHRITELYIKNNSSLEVTNYGIRSIADYNNPYDSYGLSESEAMEIVAFSNAIWGYALAVGVHDDAEWFEENLWGKIREIYQKDLAVKRKNIEKLKESEKSGD